MQKASQAFDFSWFFSNENNSLSSLTSSFSSIFEGIKEKLASIFADIPLLSGLFSQNKAIETKITRPKVSDLYPQNMQCIPSHGVTRGQENTFKTAPDLNRSFTGPATGISCLTNHAVSNTLSYQTQSDAWNASADLIAAREGFSAKIYPDSEGHPTVGVGHLLTQQEMRQNGWKMGDTIPNDKLMEMYSKDMEESYGAAIKQAQTLGIKDPQMIASLTSVNFQLGVDWYKEHKDTWSLMKQGRFTEAAYEAADSRWANQTPIRVRDFQQNLVRYDQLDNPTTMIASAPSPNMG